MKLPHDTIHNLEEGINEAFEDFPEVEAVFLFGSVAEGRAGAESDLDLAIVPSGAGLRERRLDLLSALVRAGLDDVDLVFLDTADVVLRYEAVRPNFLIYARESFDHGEYYSRTLREYWDFLPYLELQRESMKRRILYGQT
jgi:predicted nucleotidyltransferase